MQTKQFNDCRKADYVSSAALAGRTSLTEPQAPVKIPLDDHGTVLLAEDEEYRVMPTQAVIVAAGRYDIHNAIRFHGGYKQVCSPAAPLFTALVVHSAHDGIYLLQGKWHI